MSTVKRIEGGGGRVPLMFIARTLQALGAIEWLAGLLATQQDTLGQALMDDQLPKRIRARKSTVETPAARAHYEWKSEGASGHWHRQHSSKKSTSVSGRQP